MSRWIAPAYTWPGDHDAWDTIINRVVPGDLVVVNPDSGPGHQKSPLWADICTQLQAKGALLLGYIPLGYLGPLMNVGHRPTSVDEALLEANRYSVWYALDGLFWDETPLTTPEALVGPLRRLHGQARGALFTKGLRRGISVFNPGTGPVPQAWLKALPGSVWVRFEGTANSYPIAPLPNPTHSAHLVHSCLPGEVGLVRQEIAIQNPAYAMLTTDVPPNQYDTPPLRP